MGVTETLVACMTGEQRSNVNLLKWCAGALELMCAGDWGLLSEKAAEVRWCDRWFRCFWIDGSVDLLWFCHHFCHFFWGGEMCNRKIKIGKQVILLQYCKWNLTLVEFLKKSGTRAVFFCKIFWDISQLKIVEVSL